MVKKAIFVGSGLGRRRGLWTLCRGTENVQFVNDVKLYTKHPTYKTN